jgi:lipopolysaccharide transport system permease protein
VSSPGSRPLLVIEPGATPLRQYAHDLWHHRDLARVLASREIKLRYRQTALGVIWVVLQPLLAAGLLGFVFGRIAELPTDGVPYFLFAYAGLMGFNVFSVSISRTTNSLVANSTLVAKIFFPRLTLPLSTALGVTIDFVVALAMLLVMLIADDRGVELALLTLPLWLVLLLMLAQGIGCVLAALSVRYRDVPQITPVLLQLALYASPVAYAVSAIPERYVGIYYLNPLTALLEGCRWATVGTALPSAGHLVYAVVVCVIVFALGLLALERLERGFADVI